ncbi:hypothetical protein T261_6419 [Streptomyces lydicus]|nr:hypothetical protein T261_6419 [Streptomyces lydicus]
MIRVAEERLSVADGAYQGERRALRRASHREVGHAARWVTRVV